VLFTATDFGGSSGSYKFDSAFGGTTYGTVGLSTYVDPSNTPFGTAIILSNLGPLPGNAFAAEDDGVQQTLDGPFSLTLGITIAHSQANQNTSFDAALKGNAVPEPGSVLVWSILVGVTAATGSWRRARRFRSR
jgi:hypothetical protein